MPPLLPLPADHEYSNIPSGDRGTELTIARMQEMSKEAAEGGKYHWNVRKKALQIIQDCGNKDWQCYGAALFNYCRDNLKYVYDPPGVEYVQAPDKTLEAGGGDCDCQVVCLVALAVSIGIPASFITLRADPNSNEFTHVFCCLYLPGNSRPFSCDPTMPFEFGQDPDPSGKMDRKEWPVVENVENHGGESMNGLCEFADDPFETVDAGVDVSDDDVAEFTMTGLGCGDKPCAACAAKAAAGMSGLGLTSGEIERTLSDLMSGALKDDLQAKKNRAYENLSYANSALITAQQMPDGPEKDQVLPAAQQASSFARNEMQSLQALIQKYSDMAGTVSTYSLGVYTPPQLAGLGIAPGVIALAAIAAVAASVVAFSYAYSQHESNANAAAASIAHTNDLVQSLKNAGVTPDNIVSVLDNIPKAPAEGSAILGQFTSIGVAAALGYVAYLFAKKKGYI